MNGDRTVDAAKVGVVSLVTVVCCALLMAGDRQGLALGTAASVVVGVSCLAQAWMLHTRVHPPVERDVWASFSRAAGAVGVGLVAEAVIDLAIRSGRLDPAWSDAGFGVAALFFCVFLYQGFVRWNQFGADDSNAAQLLNGLCAVLVTVAAGGLLIRVTGAPMSAWTQWHVETWLAHLGALVVLCGTAATVAVVGGMVRDKRIHMLTAALGASAVVQLTLGFVGDVSLVGTTTEVLWILLVTVLGVCSLMEPPPVKAPVRPTQSLVIGALVLLAASLVVLALDGVLDGGHIPTVVIASAAALGCGTSLLHLVKTLAGLAQSQEEARTDDLTGISNRRALSAALKEAAESGQPAALLIVDLDRFKEINDHHGHTIGDEVLQILAARLQAVLPSRSLLGRLGSDEFAVLLPGANPWDAKTLAWRLVGVCAEPVETGAGWMTLGASVGVAATEGELRDGELMRRADTAMYVAKRGGGGQVRMFDGDADRHARSEHERLEELRLLLGPGASWRDREQLVIHYQPQLQVRTGNVVGAEALVRWQHPELGLLYPDAFLDLVERHGLMAELTTHVLRKATSEAVGWHRRGHRIRVSVNLSTSSLSDPNLLKNVDQVTAETGIETSLLVLEITETTLMSDPDRALQATRAIRSRGIGLSIDDYGTGYSSLAYLNDLPAVELKLDRRFTARILEQRTAAIVAGTIDLAHGLGMRLLAEGVEDEQTLAILRKLGCDETQGYLHTRPMSADRFSAWLEESTHPSGDVSRPVPAARRA